MEKEGIVKTIRDFLKDEFLGDKAKALELDSPIFTSGLVDSFGVLQFICFLEETYQTEIDTTKHRITDFDTIDKVSNLIFYLLNK